MCHNQGLGDLHADLQCLPERERTLAANDRLRTHLT
jgi:hypothetical protein